MSSLEFLPPFSSWGYETEANSWTRWTNGGDGDLIAPLSLPSGAKVVSVKFEFYDSSEDDITVSLLTCESLTDNCQDHPFAGAGPEDCLIPGRICSGEEVFQEGFGSVAAALTPDDITTDNLDHSYFLLVRRVILGSSLRIVGIVVGYVLQVSPSPASATFNDVPTNHPFFQFVEALAASGITAGCGGSKFCPNAPLTRGQMAVFLSRALGLQWP